MQSGTWERLALPFGQDALEWRVLEVKTGDDATDQARVRPQLRFERVVARLDETLTPAGWSNRYVGLGMNALACELTLEGVTKSGVVALNGAGSTVLFTVCVQDALVYAAELFGLKPPADPHLVYWVDYDPEAGVPLFEPDLAAAHVENAAETFAETGLGSSVSPSRGQPPADEPPAPKPAGQQAIDRLVERLRGEGKGLEVAKLVTTYGGYGDDPEAAKELYSQLRALLLKAPPS